MCGWVFCHPHLQRRLIKDCAHIEVLLQKLYESPLQQAMKPNRQILRYLSNWIYFYGEKHRSA